MGNWPAKKEGKKITQLVFKGEARLASGLSLALSHAKNHGHERSGRLESWLCCISSTGCLFGRSRNQPNETVAFFSSPIYFLKLH